jgi:RNA polymerase sigma-70 factor (sigma-E family)
MTTREEPTFAEFASARWAPLFRTAYLLTGSRHEAEDLLQTALARTFVRWNGIRDKRAADAYVRRAMANQVTRHWRNRGREVPVEHLPEPSDDGGLGSRDDRMQLWQEILKLPPRMRATLVLRYYEDLSEAATAAELGCSVGAVKSQTHHALRRLRAVLGEHDLAAALTEEQP